MTRTGKKLHIRILASCTAAVMIAATAYAAQEPMVFPAKGQSNEKMESDKNGCYTWAKGQTGFDPMQTQAAATPPPTSKSSAVRGAGGGAALGAAVGAISGSAGTGAAIGAATGGIIGGARKQKSKKEQEQSAQQQTASIEQQRSDYTRAYGACMEGKGYTVK